MPTDSHPNGPPWGVDVRLGQHVCCIYETEEERRAVLTPLIIQGLERGEKVLYLADVQSSEIVLGYLRHSGLDPGPYLGSGQLALLTSEKAYLSDGAFDPDRMIDLIRSQTARALADGWTALRATGEMTWAFRGEQGSERLIEYEAKLNGFLPGSRCLGVCQYDRRRFPPEILLDVLHTHPFVLLGSERCDNVYHMPPAAFLANRPEARLQQWTKALIDRSAHLRRQELTATLLDELMATTTDNIYFKDRDGRFIKINRALARWFGLAHPDDAVGKTDADFFGEAHARRAHADEQRLMTTGEPLVGVEEEETWPDGRVTWVTTSKVPIRDGAGTIVGLVGISRDITRHRVAMEALRQSEERYRTLFDESLDGLFLASPGGQIVDINKKGVQMLGGSTREEVLGLDLARDVCARPAEGQRLLATAQREGSAEADLEVRPRSGPPMTAQCSLVADRDASGATTSYRGAIRDVTKQRRLEEQLRQAQKMEAVGRLAGGIAHDFNNLLGVILGYSESALGKTPETDPRHRKIEQVVAAAERAADLTRQLLAFSRRQVLEPKVLDLNVLLRNLAKMLPRLLGEDIDLRMSLAPDLGSVRADPGQLEQVVMNLAANARDAMPSGGWLAIETANADLDEAYTRRHTGAQPGAFVQLSVSDCGSGMDEETQRHVFEPFFTTKEKHKGTGLGLATVYGIVKQSGGWIWVYSEVGRGTTFKIYLPRCEELPDAPPPEAPPATPRGTETVLLVEDDPALREFARETLEASGYTVLAAGSGAEALALAETHPGPVDLLLSDVVMPEMSGSQLGQELLARFPAARVLFMSGYTDDAIVSHGVLDSHTPLLAKPFTGSTLARRVREALAGRRTPSATTGSPTA